MDKLEKDKLEKIELGKLLIAGFLAGGVFLYFVWGAMHSGIFIPGRWASPDNTVQGGSAWVMCLAPIFFFAAHFVEFSSKLSLEPSARKKWHWALMIMAILLICLPVVL